MDIYANYKKPLRENSRIFLQCTKYHSAVWRFLVDQTISYENQTGKVTQVHKDGRFTVALQGNPDPMTLSVSTLENGLKISLSQDFIDWVLENNDPQLRNVRAEFEEIIEEQKQKTERAEKKRKERIARLAKEQHKQKVLQPFNEFLQLVATSFSNQHSVFINSPELLISDIALALEWSKLDSWDKKTILSDPREAIKSGDFQHDYELGRVLSARAAEKAALRFFRHLGSHVQDVSIQQIKGDSTEERWKKGDLVIDGTLYDVKNSRRSPSNQDAYVEHTIPHWKQSRSGDDVKIIGTLSHYLWPKTLMYPDDWDSETNILILGETDYGKILSMIEYFEIPDHLEISFKRHNQKNNQFLPPWVFDYPDSFFEDRKQAIHKMRELPIPSYSNLDHIPDEGFDRRKYQLLPIFISAGCEFIEQWNEHQLTRWELDFIEKVRTWNDIGNLSLPYLYLTVLSHFVEMICAGATPRDFSPAQYKRLIFWNENNSYPLLIFDPLKTVYSLIESLTTLWEQTDIDIHEFSMFKLQGLNIVRARRSEVEQWKTLIAYCGGWDKSENRSCGNTPLVAGKSKHCEECGKLICPRCGFCSPHVLCIKSAPRQEQFIASVDQEIYL